MQTHVFYILTGGEYYCAVIKGHKSEIHDYLESISEEVAYKGILKHKVKEPAHKEIPCGTLLQFKYYGSHLPRGVKGDRRFHELR